MLAKNTTNYSPFDQVAFKNIGRSDTMPVQESKGKKGKKKMVGVISETVARPDIPEYTTEDFIEDSKREKEREDQFKVVTRGPRFDDYDDELPQYSPPSKKNAKSKISKD